MVEIDLEDVGAKAVDEATDPDTFDVLAFFSGVTLPKDKVTLYRDYEAAYELASILEAEAQREKDAKERKGSDPLDITFEEAVESEEHIEDLRERLLASAATFHLVGLAPKVQTAIEKKLKATNGNLSEEDFNALLNETIIAKTIDHVEDAQGRVSYRKWSQEEIHRLIEELPPAEFTKLYTSVLKVTYIGNVVDRAISTDF